MFGSPYELFEKLGEGGMGVVHRARHRETGQIVAVKIMSSAAAADPTLRVRFEQEYLTAGRLIHPNMVRAFACDMTGKRPYFVMELVEGQSLGKRIAHEGPLAEDEALHIIRQVADALAFAHDLQLIHRDVKPDNILLTPEGQARLTDLGLVKDLGLNTNLTCARTGLGTAAYIAPEQADNAMLADVRCDIYSLGATLYHALTGMPPFQGRVRVVLLKKQMLNDFIPPRQLVPTIHPRVDLAICRALDSCPDKRQQSCREFIASLARTPLGEAEEKQLKVPARPVAQALAALERAAERRKARRFPCETPIACMPFCSPQARILGKLQDISLTGVQVLLPRRFEPGALLTGEILDKEQQPLLHFLIRVWWAKKGKGGQWMLGCAFDREISAEILNEVLGNPATTIVINCGDC